MTQIFRRQFLPLFLLVAMAGSAFAGDISVTGAFARASATPVAKAGAAYMTLVNDGQEPDRLIGVSAEIAGMSHLHETKSENGVMSMSAVDGLDVPAGGKVALQPGGLHVMMMGLKAPREGRQDHDRCTGGLACRFRSRVRTGLLEAARGAVSTLRLPT
jgi:copper(I)-binding protein